MSTLSVTLLLTLAAIALLAGARLFLLRPPERRPDYRGAFGGDPHTALQELLAGPDGSAGRAAEARGNWAEARAAYARALDAVRLEEPGVPGVALKRRTLESKLEELERLIRS